MEEKQFRDKVYWLTFLFSLMVVWVHSFNGELFMGNPEAAFKVAGIERILGEKLGQIAVPGFFMVSSYLFFPRVLLEEAPSKVAFQDKKSAPALSFVEFSLLYRVCGGHPPARPVRGGGKDAHPL